MSELQLNFEWVDPQGAKIPELRATWASFRITVNGEPITRLFDHQLNSVRDTVFIPLYPLTEWIALHWWNLLFESKTPGRATKSNYDSRHYLRYAREGYALPDLAITPVGKDIEFEWHVTNLPNYKLEFIRSGSARIEVCQVEEIFSRFINSVIERLHQNNIHDSLLEGEWSAIVAADDEEKEFCIAAAKLGVNPYNLREEVIDAILSVNDSLPSSIFDSFFRAANVNQLVKQAEKLKSTIEQLKASGTKVPRFTELRNQLHHYNLRDKPWIEGYTYARELRRILKVEDKIFPDLEAFGKVLDLSEDTLNAIVRETDSSRLFDALVVINQADSPSFAIDKKNKDAKNFTFCRGLFEFLNSANGSPLLITKSQTERQQRNRAFAAEFLSPSDLLSQRISSSVIDREEVEDLATEFGVSSFVIEHQLKNHKLIKEIID